MNRWEDVIGQIQFGWMDTIWWIDLYQNCISICICISMFLVFKLKFCILDTFVILLNSGFLYRSIVFVWWNPGFLYGSVFMEWNLGFLHRSMMKYRISVWLNNIYVMKSRISVWIHSIYEMKSGISLWIHDEVQDFCMDP